MPFALDFIYTTDLTFEKSHEIGFRNIMPQDRQFEYRVRRSFSNRSHVMCWAIKTIMDPWAAWIRTFSCPGTLTCFTPQSSHLVRGTHMDIGLKLKEFKWRQVLRLYRARCSLVSRISRKEFAAGFEINMNIELPSSTLSHWRNVTMDLRDQCYLKKVHVRSAWSIF